MNRPLRHTPSTESVAPLTLRDGLTDNSQPWNTFNPFFDSDELSGFIECNGNATQSNRGHPIRYAHIAYYLGVSEDSVRRYSKLDIIRKHVDSNIDNRTQALAEQLPSHNVDFIRENASVNRSHYLASRGLPADKIDELVRLYELADELEWADAELNSIPAGHTQGEAFMAAWIPYRFWNEFLKCPSTMKTRWIPKARASLIYRVSEHGLFDHAQPICGRPLTTMTLGRHRLYRIDELDKRFPKR